MSWWWLVLAFFVGTCAGVFLIALLIAGREERVCETGGQRNIPEDALSGPVGINVARLIGIELPEIGEHPNTEPEVRLVKNVAVQDTQIDD